MGNFDVKLDLKTLEIQIQILKSHLMYLVQHYPCPIHDRYHKYGFTNDLRQLILDKNAPKLAFWHQIRFSDLRKTLFTPGK